MTDSRSGVPARGGPLTVGETTERSGGTAAPAKADRSQLASLSDTTTRMRRAIEGVIEGKRETVRLAITVMLAEGHLLIEDVPGVGKTMLAKALARSVDSSVRRVPVSPPPPAPALTRRLLFHHE